MPRKHSAQHTGRDGTDNMLDTSAGMSQGFFDEQYINMARHNLASEQGASIIWGQRELQLREGMLSVFLKDDGVRNIVFQQNENNNESQQDLKYLDLGSMRDTLSVMGDKSISQLNMQGDSQRKYGVPVRKSSVS